MLTVLSGPLCCVLAILMAQRVHFFTGSRAKSALLRFSLLSLFHFFLCLSLFAWLCVSSHFLSHSSISTLQSLLSRARQQEAGMQHRRVVFPIINSGAAAHMRSRGWPWTLPLVPGIFRVIFGCLLFLKFECDLRQISWENQCQDICDYHQGYALANPPFKLHEFIVAPNLFVTQGLMKFTKSIVVS